MATAYQYFGTTQSNGYTNTHEPTPQHYEYTQPHPMLPGLSPPNTFGPQQKRISYMSRDQALQHQSFSVQAEPMPFMQQFLPNASQQQAPSHLIDAQTYQQRAEERKKKHTKKRKSNINQALPRPLSPNSYNQPNKSRETTPMSNGSVPTNGHHHKISNQEPITQFQELNNTLKQRHKIGHQIGSALPSNSNIYTKESNSVASTRNPSFSLQHTAHLVDDLEDIQDIEDNIEDMSDIPQPLMQHNNTRITHTTNLTQMTELTELTDMSLNPDDDDVDDVATVQVHADADDDATSIANSVINPHVASLSTELKSFQDGLKHINPTTVSITDPSFKSHTMPKSSLALMNTGMLDSDGNLSKQSILLINRVRDKSAIMRTAPKLDKIISVDDMDNHREESNGSLPRPHHKKIPSDVSGMSSISNTHYKYRYNGNQRAYRSRRRHKKQESVVSAYSVASTEVLTPKPGSTRTPNESKKFDFREDKDKANENSLHKQSTSNEALTTMNQIKLHHNPIGLEPIDSPTIVRNKEQMVSKLMKPPAIETVTDSNNSQVTQKRTDRTPIAFSTVNQNTGKLKCLYRFVLNDRDKEIAIGDIVKAPIPQQMHTRKEMKFNAIINKKEEQSDDVQVITNNKLASHYVGIVRYLGTTSSVKEDETVTFLGLELMDPIGDCDGTMLDSETGDYIRPFITRPNYAVFVSVGGVVKITPSILLNTLTDTIQKLNKHIVTLCQDNYVQLQQLNKQQKQMYALDQKNKRLAKLATSQLGKINNIRASNLSAMGSESIHNDRTSPTEVTYTTNTNSFPANSVLSSEAAPSPRRNKNDKHTLIKPAEDDANLATNIIVSHGHQMQPSFASGYGIISGNIQQYKHTHNPSMVSAVSAMSTQPQLHGITHINAQNIHVIAPPNGTVLQSPKLGHQPTPEIHRADIASFGNHHTTVKSNMSDLELMQSSYAQANNIQVSNVPNNTIILSNGQYAHAPIVPRMRQYNAPQLSPNSHRSQPVTPPQPVLHQAFANTITPNIIQSQQYIFMEPQRNANAPHNNQNQQFLNPNPLKQIGISSIPASPPKIKEITPTPSPQPPAAQQQQQQQQITAHPPPANQPYSKISNRNIADIVLQSNPDEMNPDTNEAETQIKKFTPNERNDRNGVQATTTIRVIDQTKLKHVIKRKSQEAAMREHLALVNREHIQVERNDSDSMEDLRNTGHNPLATPMHELDRIDLQASASEDEAVEMQDMQRADSGEMTEIVMSKYSKPKRRRRSSVLSSHAVPPPDQNMASERDRDGYNAGDDSDNAASSTSSSEDGLGPKSRSKLSYRKSFEIANGLRSIVVYDANNEEEDDDEQDENVHSPESTPYRIQVTPPTHMHEELLNFNMSMAPNLAPKLRKEVSNPILNISLSGDDIEFESDGDTNSTAADGGDNTPKPTTPYTPYTDGEDEAKLSRPDQSYNSDLNHFDEEHNDDSPTAQDTNKETLIIAETDDAKDTPKKENNEPHRKEFKEKKLPYISKSPTVTRKKKKLGRKKTITRSSTQNYDHKDPFRAPWEKQSEGNASPVSVSHGTGYDVHLINAAAQEEDSSSGRSMSLSESSSEDQDNESSSNPTDHELDEEASPTPDADAEDKIVDTDADLQADAERLGLFMQLNSLKCSDPIIESQGEEEEEEDDDEEESEPRVDLDKDEIVDIINTQNDNEAEKDNDNEEEKEKKLESPPMLPPNMQLSVSYSNEATQIDPESELPQLKKLNTGEIQLQSYDVGAPPTRHNRKDTAHLLHKKRGTLKDIRAFSAENEASKVENDNLDIDRDDLGSNDSDDEDHVLEYVLLLDAEEEDGLSDMITPQPKEKVVPPSMPSIPQMATRFSFAEELDKDEKQANDDDDNNSEEEAFGVLEIKQIAKKYESGEISSITPISKQNYGVAAPPTKHNRDNSTVHDRMRLNVTELNALLKKSPRIDTIIQDVEIAQNEADEEAEDKGSRGSIEYSSDEIDDVELMDYQSLQRLEATDSQVPFPGAMHLQMSTATREYVEDLGLSVEDNMDEMDLTDEEDLDDEELLHPDDDLEEPEPEPQTKNEVYLLQANTSVNDSSDASIPVPLEQNSGSGSASSPSTSVTPSPRHKAMPHIPNPGLIVNHSVDSIGSVASDKGPVRPQRASNHKTHQAARSMSSLNTLNVMNMNIDVTPRSSFGGTPSSSSKHAHLQLPSPHMMNRSDDENFDESQGSQGSILIHEQVENTESMINDSMDLGEDILDELEFEADRNEKEERHNTEKELDDGMMTDEDGTDINKKKGYTKKMRKFVPAIKAADVESVEIMKQIENFKSGSAKEEKSPKKKRRKSKKSKRLHQTSPRKVHSPVLQHIYHKGAMHSPYDQLIYRPELENNASAGQQSSRHYSVKSKRSNRSSDSSQRRNSKRNSKSSSRERRKSKQKRNSKSRKKKSKRRHKKQHSHSRSSSASGSSDDNSYSFDPNSSNQSLHKRKHGVNDGYEDKQTVEAQNMSNGMQQFYPQHTQQPFYPQQHAQFIAAQQQQQQQQQHFQSHSLPHLAQVVPQPQPQQQQFIPNHHINYNQAPNIHQSSMSHGAIDFHTIQNSMFQPQQQQQQAQQQQQQQQQQIQYQQYHPQINHNHHNSQQW